jgi:uncharacterized protein YgiM (DUF1202 family)
MLTLQMPLSASAVTESSKAGRVEITSGYLNVRKTANKTSEVVSTLNKGDFVTLIQKSGDWWQVEYATNKYGYCHSNYITAVGGTIKKVTLTSGTLNVRSGAGTSYSRIAGLSNGKIVIELSNANGWSKILFGGAKTGYVSSQYLKTTNNSVTYPSVKLNVPSYKQYDSRWANVKIGSSGKTISQIGCATTAIAMIESFRKGSAIYPDAMSKKLKYTATGSVFWPSDYRVVTSNSDYLSKIYSNLKNGKAVLLGSKKSYGSQHWVVITGYSGGDNLSTDKFIINDPGSKTRTTLKAFLTDYPNFYKYFYY